MIALLLIWIVSIVCGIYVGKGRHQVVAGLLLTLFLGPLGLLILFFLPDEKRETEEHEKRLGSLEQQLFSQRDEQTQKMLEQAKAARLQKAEPPQDISLRVARNGQDLGEMKLGVIKTMLGAGQLAPEDFYLDSTSNEWVPLECHPSLIR